MEKTDLLLWFPEKLASVRSYIEACLRKLDARMDKPKKRPTLKLYPLDIIDAQMIEYVIKQDFADLKYEFCMPNGKSWRGASNKDTRKKKARQPPCKG